MGPGNLSDSSSKLAGGEVVVLGERKQQILAAEPPVCSWPTGEAITEALSTAAQPSREPALGFAACYCSQVGHTHTHTLPLISLYIVDDSASELRLMSGNLLHHYLEDLARSYFGLVVGFFTQCLLNPRQASK